LEKKVWLWLRRRWMELRLGHTTYLVFFISAVNFVLISYRLLIERVPFLEKMFPSLWIFAVVFSAIYIPLAILIGRWHRLRQLKIDQTILVEQNPVIMEIYERVKRMEAILEEMMENER